MAIKSRLVAVCCLGSLLISYLLDGTLMHRAGFRRKQTALFYLQRPGLLLHPFTSIETWPAVPSLATAVRTEPSAFYRNQISLQAHRPSLLAKVTGIRY
ncbi:hypothetical protein GDO78_016277 [Eleutherodactylus coqui]|uniref:Uncharacterized protein n=1 Tax=Eleutherodactylus coqui TaxID=57060 RepID=A0A8J6E8C6_ELECQ|nr:hypothetical protein GDO78_016277 [Eleutherodactylus coqui]